MTSDNAIVLTSPDCIVWTQHTIQSGSIYDPIWNGSVFCGINYAGSPSYQSMTSPDGSTWSYGPPIYGAQVLHLAWNTSVFCGIGSGFLITSHDGLNWTLIGTPNIAAIAWNGSVYCALASPSSLCYTSPDGVTWTQHSLPVFGTWTTIYWTGTVFITIPSGTQTFYTSPDGVTWTAVGTIPGLVWTGSSLCGNDSIICTMVNNFNYIVTSIDGGATWTKAATLPLISSPWYTLVWNDSIFCALLYNTNAAITSPDGINWTQRKLPVSGGWQKLAWNGNIFCGLLLSGSTVITSSDGINWTATNSLPNLTWRTLSWNGGVFVLVSSSGILLTSPDGITWTKRTIPSITPNVNCSAVGSNGDVVVGGTNGTQLIKKDPSLLEVSPTIDAGLYPLINWS